MQLPTLDFQLNPQFAVYLILGSFGLGYALGWLGRPERGSMHYTDDFVTKETLDHIHRIEGTKGYPL